MKCASLLFMLWIPVAIGSARICYSGPPTHDAVGGEGELLARSGDAYVRQSGAVWTFGTSKVEKKIRFENGHLALVSFRNQTTRHEFLEGASDPFRFDLDGREVSGQSERWILVGAHTETLRQGELLFTITFCNHDVAVSKNFIIYPGEMVIQESLTIRNISGRDETLAAPYFLEMHVMKNEASDIDFSYMTGGMCFWGSWILKTQPLTPEYARHFDANDPPECLPGKPCPKGWPTMGNSTYAPIQVYFDRKTQDGVYVGWDYLGRWGSYVGNYRGGPVYVGLLVAGYQKLLPARASIETPWAFTGVFEKDLDEMGNELLDYQYRYKWDYTRNQYFPGVQMLGYWWNGASDLDPKHPGMGVDPISTFRKMFRMADEMRYVGADIYWRDYGWWDIAGDWNGPDFFEGGRYLAKYGMRRTIYTIVYDAQQGSKVVTDHPDWMVYKGGNFAGEYLLDQSKPGVIDWELKLLNNEVRQWGDFEWRKDDAPLHPVNGDYTPMLAQDHNFRRLLKSFLDQNPHSAFHGCNGGGNDLGYEVLRMATAWQYSDGCVGRYLNHYASYLFPPDKVLDMPDVWNPDKFDKASWYGLLWSAIGMTGDTLDRDKNEDLRQLIDIYHYLGHEGVVGRWVKVYHPRVTGDDPSWYLQRMSRDNLRGVIIPAHAPKTRITIFPKGLLPGTSYNVSYQQTKGAEKRLGSDLMTKGISFSSVPDGELIYFNLPMHPGSVADKTPPTMPQQVVKTIGTNMDFIGVELSWAPATDNNWISYYQIFRNGVAIDKVAKGDYYFDHSAGADLSAQYEVAAIDGSGNISGKAAAQGAATPPAQVIDDADNALKYSGSGWEHERNVWAVFDGTQSRTRNAKDTVEYTFVGNRLTWYGRLGSAMGRADVYVDGKLDQVVDTYNADEIPNVALYSRTFPSTGQHTVKILARGDHNWRSSDNWIVVDGFQVGKEEFQVIEDPPGQGIKYSGSGWRHSQGWRRASGKSASWTRHDGDTAECVFRGDGITWVGKRCPACGIADVYVDGQLEARVDTYAPDFHRFRDDAQGAWQVPIFEKTWVRPGQHTLLIVARNLKNMLATGYKIYVDSFQVHGH
jgi:hypothetical protein